LPQGGIDAGENSAQAAKRELQEEINALVDTLYTTNIVYEYMFPTSVVQRYADTYCGQQVVFHVGICTNPHDLRVDNHEIDNFAWITIAELHQYVERTEYATIIEHLAAQAPKILAL
jgi:8-oxo-dGTP pyrophosphatase MutT (NUDIX family)